MLTVFQLILYSLVSGELFEVHLVLICLLPFVCYILFCLPTVCNLFFFLFFLSVFPSMVSGAR